jgi:hypothetical protein
MLVATSPIKAHHAKVDRIYAGNLSSELRTISRLYLSVRNFSVRGPRIAVAAGIMEKASRQYPRISPTSITLGHKYHCINFILIVSDTEESWLLFLSLLTF